jgi:nucleotide-binding universal stress UspA family protein
VNTILLATDGSPSAEAATKEAIALARATGWTLRVVTVWRTPVITGYGLAPAACVPEAAEFEREQAAAVALAAVARAAEAGIGSTWELREGVVPAREICAAADEANARLIVIGAHGWGAIQRLVFGSVSAAVMHRAHRPVLVVRAPEAEERDAFETRKAVA